MPEDWMAKFNTKKLQQLLEDAEKLLESGKSDQAMQCAAKALKLDPSNARAWFYKGVAEDSLGNFAGAVDSYERSAKTAQEQAFLPLYNMGNTLRAMGHTDRAIAAYYKALKLNGQFKDPWVNLGALLDNKGEREEAVRCYEAALKIDPNDSDAWSNKGNSLRGLLNFAAALDCYKKALEIDSQYISAHVGVAACLGQLGDPKRGLSVLEGVFEPSSPRMIVEKGVLLALAGRNDDAVKAYDAAIAKGTATAEVWCNRGDALLELKRHEAAVESFDRALSFDPTSTQAWFGKARVFFSKKQPTEAQAAIEKYFEVADSKDRFREAATAVRARIQRI